ncbi:MAG: helix-turn-helix domain-containing protein [Eubacteriaceae bacterium]|nr:helix-turn-helix domain-containing protein [Eubacteriaceae bacterium]
MIYNLYSKNCNVEIICSGKSGISIKGACVYSSEAPLMSGYLYIETSGCQGIAIDPSCAYLAANSVKPNPKWKQYSNFALTSDKRPASEIAASINSIVIELLQWDNSLKEALLQKKNVEEIFRIIHPLFGNPMVLITQYLDYAAHSVNYPLENNLNIDPEKKSAPYEKALEILHNPNQVNANYIEGVFLYPSEPKPDRLRRNMCYNIFENGQYIARILARLEGQNPGQGEHELFSHICVYIEAAYLSSVDDAFSKRQQDLLHGLIRGLCSANFPINKNSLEAVFTESQTWKENHVYSLIAVQSTTSIDSYKTSFICRQLENACISCAVVVDNGRQIIWVVNHTLSEKGMEIPIQMLELIARDFNCSAGASNMFCGISGLHSSYVQANAALEIGEAEAGWKPCHFFSEFSLAYILDRARSGLDTSHLLHDGVERLLAYDEKENASYLQSLKNYIISGFSITKAAKISFVHRTTFLRRLERIIQISALNLGDFDTLLHVMVSLKLLEDGDS